MATITEALKYPFTNIKRLFNIWWVLIPIWGWFVMGGYGIRILTRLVKGDTKELPPIRPFKGLFKTGFLFAVAYLIVYIPSYFLFIFVPIVRWVIFVYFMLILPLLVFQFAEKQRIRDGINIIRATQIVFTHFGEYLLAYFKTLVVGIIFLFASIPIITLIVTYPAIMISQYYFFAEYYKTFAPKRK